MAYEIFARKTPRPGKAVMSFSKIGSIVFNQSAARIFSESKIKDVLLLWDSKTQQLALQRTPESEDDRAYTIRFNDKANGASFSAKPFLDHIGVKYERKDRIQIPISIKTDSEIFLETKIPASLFVPEDINFAPAETAEVTSSPGSSEG